jgi:hypothetical protein
VNQAEDFNIYIYKEEKSAFVENKFSSSTSNLSSSSPQFLALSSLRGLENIDLRRYFDAGDKKRHKENKPDNQLTKLSLS